MLTKLAHLNFNPGKIIHPVYLLTGTDPFQLNHYAQIIVKGWQEQHRESARYILQLNTAADWHTLHDYAKTQSLFNETQIIDCRYEKKTIEAAAKDFLHKYLQQANENALIIIRAPQLPFKAAQALTTIKNLHIIVGQTISAQNIKQWLSQQLHELKFSFTPEIPELIFQFNENNLFGCAQLIEKLSLIFAPNTSLNIADIQEQLCVQYDLPLFELGDSCLRADKNRALQLIQLCSNNKTEPSLVLWLIAQEIRNLLSLQQALRAGLSLADACSKIKIWSTKVNIYQRAVQRYSGLSLNKLLTDCHKLDLSIKTGKSMVWQELAMLVLRFCQGEEIASLV